MAELNLLLSDTLRNYLDHLVDCGEFASPSDYISDLIRRDQALHQTALEETLLEALDSGETEWPVEELTAPGLIAAIKARRVKAA